MLRSDRSGTWTPKTCVWELTLACNLDCLHCGSRAGKVRPGELATEQCLDVVSQLSDLGCELLTLSGGEPTLKRGWHRIAAAAVEAGMYCNMVTNGVYRNDSARAEIVSQAIEAGMCNVGVSLDGPPSIHDRIRGEGNYARAVQSVREFTEAGLPVAVLTTVNRLNIDRLDEVRLRVIDAGATQWRLQLAKPMGNLSDHDELVISPIDMLSLLPKLARMKRQPGVALHIGDSIGYYGAPDRVLRSRGWRGKRESWRGCQAGMRAIGIEANGNIKGCLSMQARYDGENSFVEGNLKENTLAEIWKKPGAFAYNREFKREQLTGFCRTCRHADRCRGGATCVAAATEGHLGEDKYCFYRMSVLQRRRRLRLAPPARLAASAFVLALSGSACDEPAEAQTSDTPVVDAGASDGLDPGLPSRDALVGDVIPDTEPDSVEDIPITEPDEVTTHDIEHDSHRDVRPRDTRADNDLRADDLRADETREDLSDASDDTYSDPDILPDRDLGSDRQDLADASDASDAGDTGDAIDCEEVCCMCEYGVIPDPVYEACCAVDPCEDVCCNCDYGMPPPPECCE